MIPTKSSNIEAFGYDAEGETLTVKFRSGRTYRYDGVPASCGDALMLAHNTGESVGRFLNTEVRPYFPATEITEGGDA